MPGSAVAAPKLALKCSTGTNALPVSSNSAASTCRHCDLCWAAPSSQAHCAKARIEMQHRNKRLTGLVQQRRFHLQKLRSLLGRSQFPGTLRHTIRIRLHYHGWTISGCGMQHACPRADCESDPG